MKLRPFRQHDPNVSPTPKQLLEAAARERERLRERGVPLSEWDEHALIRSLWRRR